MSTLPELNYKYIGKFSTGAGTAQSFLGTLATAFASNTYADGSSRSFGTGSAWTPSLIQSSSAGSFVTIAVSLAPVSSSLSQRIIFAGGQTVAPSPSPTMLGSDANSTSNNRIIFGLAKNTVNGTITNWSNSNPYTSGSFTGYLGFAVANSSTPFVHVYESQETVVVIAEYSVGTTAICAAGALLDPETTTAGNAESDGKIYGVFSSGYNASSTIINGGNTGQQTFLSYGGSTAGFAKSYIFNFGSSAVLLTSRHVLPYNTTTFKNTSGEFIRQQIYMEAGTGGTFYGRLREITMFPVNLSFTKFTVSNIVNGFIVGAASNATSQCILLKA
jgi:hypothetical protein